jgi:hypothetical protein
MPDIHVGTAGGRKRVTNPVVGTAAGNKPVSKIWVGTGGGNKLVWQRTTMATTVTATAVSTTGIDVSWTATQGAVYSLFRRRTGVAGEVGLVANTSARTYSDRGLVEGAEYIYYVNVVVNGALVGHSNLASVTTGVTPPPAFVQKSWTGAAVEAASYTGSNSLRTRNPLYYGYYSSNQGTQKSQVRFDIPAEIRNCVSVDKVEVRWWNQHTYLGTGGTVSMVAHHNGNLSSYTGNTGPLLMPNGEQVRWSAPRGGFIGGGEWYEVGFLHSYSGGVRRPDINEEIRVGGLTGFGLVEAVGGTSGYGYASADPQLRIHYTIRT